jgi:hypothetical protein
VFLDVWYIIKTKQIKNELTGANYFNLQGVGVSKGGLGEIIMLKVDYS